MFPVVLFGRTYWQGLLGWIASTVLAEGKINPPDLDLLKVTDDPAEAVEVITAAYRHSQEAQHGADGIPETWDPDPKPIH
jgi:predicted Rossmann-fold nucleotide-binding protein